MTDHQQYNPKRPEPKANIEQRGPHSFLRTGSFMSPNFSSGHRGWKIDADGNAEFQDGTFRGKFTIGGFNITVSTVADIYDAISEVERNGGGVVYIADGTYVLTDDIYVPGGVALRGQNRDGTILDCNSSYSVRAVGGTSYTTGSVSITNGSTTLTGSGVTAWDSTMVGQSVLLGEDGDFLWYEISAVTDTATITLATEYAGPTLVSDTYTIATVNLNPIIGRLTVTNATGPGVYLQYAMESDLDDIVVYGCGTGVMMSQAVFPRLFLTSTENGRNIDCREVSGFKIDFNDISFATTDYGIAFDSCGNATFFDSAVYANASSGVYMQNCTGITMMSVGSDSNGLDGFEFASNCDNIQMVGTSMRSNGRDGARLTATSDGTMLSSSIVAQNGVYGVNIMAASCNSTIVLGNVFYTNGTDAALNNGTGTKIRSNVGLSDN